jgi:uncharacterized protein YutE (UPF0331/DUF86 family)
MRYDVEKLTRLVSELKNALTLLKSLSSMDYCDFSADPHRIASAKYNLIVAIEAVIDICNHFISKNGYRVPEDYADTFLVLQENKLLPMEMLDSLMKMAKFRNRLVHLYWQIDLKQLFAILGENLNDFDIFLEWMGKTIEF